MTAAPALDACRLHPCVQRYRLTGLSVVNVFEHAIGPEQKNAMRWIRGAGAAGNTFSRAEQLNRFLRYDCRGMLLRRRERCACSPAPDLRFRFCLDPAFDHSFCVAITCC